MLTKRGSITINVICFTIVVISIFVIFYKLNIFNDQYTNNKKEGFGFITSTNSFGDRILLQAPAKIRYVTQKNTPDLISISPSSGEYSGSFVWTIIPNQGGVRRILGEYEVGGRTYKVCEFLYNINKEATGTAERFFVINNNGSKYRNPEKIDATPFSELFNVIQPEQARVQTGPLGPNTEGLPATPDLARRASALIGICTGYQGTPA